MTIYIYMASTEIAEKEQSPEKEISKETAMLVAAKYGVVEIIEKILGTFSNGNLRQRHTEQEHSVDSIGEQACENAQVLAKQV